MITFDVILVASSIPRPLGTKRSISFWRRNVGLSASDCKFLAGTLALLGSEYLGQPVGVKAERKNGAGLWGPEEHFFGRPSLICKLQQL